MNVSEKHGLTAKTDPRDRTGKPDKKAWEMATQRRALLKLECERRGVRFLPAQVMRPIYERNGLL